MICLFCFTNDLTPITYLPFWILSLPVKLGVFYKDIAVSVSNEHFAAHTSETFWVVLLLSSNLFHKQQWGTVSVLILTIISSAFFCYESLLTRPLIIGRFSEDFLRYELGGKKAFSFTACGNKKAGRL